MKDERPQTIDSRSASSTFGDMGRSPAASEAESVRACARENEREREREVRGDVGQTHDRKRAQDEKDRDRARRRRAREVGEEGDAEASKTARRRECSADRE